MPRPTITYNASSGSSSSSGSGETLVSGSSATVNGGDPGTVIDLDGSPDLSGLTADTSAIWLSGIGLYRITAINDGADQVTVHASVSLGGGVAWGIGGTRDNPRSDTFDDEDTGEAGWTYEFEDGTYDGGGSTYTFPSGDTTQGPTIVRGAAGADATLTQGGTTTHNVTQGGSTLLRFENLTLASDAFRSCWNGSGHHIVFDRVTFEPVGDGTGIDVNGESSITVTDCVFDTTPGDSGTEAVFLQSGRMALCFSGCVFIGDGANDGFVVSTNTSFGQDYTIENCTFRDFGAAITVDLALSWNAICVSNCTFENNGDGIEFQVGQNANGGMKILNCLFVNSSSYGIDIFAAVDEFKVIADYNAFYNNTSGAYNNHAGGANDVTLTVDPFTDVTGHDYSLNATAGGGADCRGAGLPPDLGTTTTSHNIGASQQAAGGSATPVYIPVSRRIF